MKRFTFRLRTGQRSVPIRCAYLFQGTPVLPYTPEDTTRLPSPAVAILKEKLAPADLAAVQALSIRLDELKAEVADGETETVTEHTDDTEALVKGGTTFNDLLEWGLSVEEIEFVLGMEMGGEINDREGFFNGEGA